MSKRYQVKENFRANHTKIMLFPCFLNNEFMNGILIKTFLNLIVLKNTRDYCFKKYSRNAQGGSSDERTIKKTKNFQSNMSKNIDQEDQRSINGRIIIINRQYHQIASHFPMLQSKLGA